MITFQLVHWWIVILEKRVSTQMCTRCMVGGRTMIRRNEKTHLQDCRISDFDAVGLYPSAQSRLGGYLKGKPKVLQSLEYEQLQGYDGYFVEIKILHVGRARDFPLMSRITDEGIRHFNNTMVGERGVMLSGGQKQRISIARALIKNPSVLVLDDCLSAVDARTENKILQQFNEVLKEKTAIVITHRIFTLIQFDKIIVLDKGKIAEEGTHDQLISRKSLYYQLFELQQSEENN